MALTKVTGQVIKNTTDVTVGVLTVTNTLAVGGTVSIGGTLTYEDVTNIDSVGLITARNGIVVGSGITLSKDGDVFFTGIATGNGSGLTALNASNLASGTVPTARLGSGTASSSTFLRGDSTFQTVNTDLVSDTSPQLGGDLASNGNDILFADNDKAIFGTGSDLKIYHNGPDNYIMASNGHIRFDTGSSELARITSTGEIKQYGFTGTSDAGSDDLVLGNTTGGVNRGMTIWSNSSQNGSIAFADNDSNFRGAVQYIHNGDILRFLTAGDERLRITSTGQLLVGDSNATGAALLQVQKASGDMVIVRNDETNYESLILSVASGTADIYASSGGSTSRPALRFITNDSERMRIQTNGDVIIGTDSYAYTKPLNVQGSTGAILSLANYDTTTYAADTHTSIEMRVNTGNTGNQNGSCEIRAFKENGTNGNNARALSFYTGGNGGSPSEKLRIASDGFVTFAGDTDTGIKNTSANILQVHTNDTLCTEFSANQRVRMPQVYSTAGSSMRDVQVESDGTLAALSSITAAKINIADVTDVSWLYNLKAKTFNFRKKTVDAVTGVNTYLNEAEDEKVYGLLAEDVETINKDFCFYDKDSEGNDVLAGVYYKTMVVPLLKAVQDLKSEIDTLKTKVAALEG